MSDETSWAELCRKLDRWLELMTPRAGYCNARTRRGTPCRSKGNHRGNRCRMHGGASSGPRTEAGRARNAEAQRKRWQQWRADKLNTEPRTT